MNAHQKKQSMPGWFPFALGAAAVTALWAGARSKWTLSGDQPKTPQPSIKQAGVIQDWAGVRLG